MDTPAPDGSGAVCSLLSVATLAAMLALPQQSAVGRLVKRLDDQSLWMLKPFGSAAVAADWECVFDPAVLQGTPMVRTALQGAPVSAAKGTGTLTMAGNFADGKIVTLGARVYTARTTVLQSTTATVVAAAGATGNGNLAVNVTIGGIVIPLEVPLLVVDQTTDALIATAIAFAMANTVAITDLYAVTHPGATVVLTRKAHAANDPTLNIAITAALGVGAVVDSVDVAGVTLAANEFQIGGSASVSIDNLIAAITAAAGAGTLYGTGTVVHALATAAAGAGDTLVATAKANGPDGNLISTTDANGEWGAATLEGGTLGTAPDFLNQDCIVGAATFYKALQVDPPVWVGPFPSA